MQAELFDWYAASKRDLPWRRTSDPYAIWLSEAMLQQTRVEAVIEYWHRFLDALPDVFALARAQEDEVLALWSGLGYYRRARQLHAAAKLIVERFDGEFPRTAEGLLELPGVGRYTAGAVASIAFGTRAAVVDGNVARVFCRRFAIDEASPSSALDRRLWQVAEEILPERDVGDWNQALMELGATICKARQPECSRCPWRGSCLALAEERIAELPRPKAKPEPIDVELNLYLCMRGEELLLVQRAESESRMPGLWELPTIEETESGLFPNELPAELLIPGEPLADLRHSITRHRIRARLLEAEYSGPMPDRFAWISRRDCADLALTGLARKALDRVRLSAPR